ncbi:transglutaminase-like domain-containing protein [Ruminococcaceae bacterium OttesenSCG-928-A16]|nr:transglutaminase-like domain-containing protein [Ruminococcaceae bacterium OttesenSCG-928-A16]
MKQLKKQTFAGALSVVLAGLLLAGCGAGSEYFHIDGSPKLANENFGRTPPPVQLAVFDNTQPATEERDGKTGTIDLTNIAKGYVAAASKSGVTTKFRVKKGEEYYDYDLDNTGKFEVYPLSLGDGTYEFTIFHNITGNQYATFLTQSVSVQLESEFAPFLVPSQIVDYNENTDCIELSYQLAQHASTNVEVVATVYHWVKNNISYDTEKAIEVLSNTLYRPVLDEIIQEKTGICYDYAAVVAAMLRANGIPCKLIMGNVQTPQDGSVYHAWNMIWLEEVGWIAVQIPTTPEEWERIDLTFAAGSGSSIEDFIGDGNNYTEMSVH